jgi:hypothetical protein
LELLAISSVAGSMANHSIKERFTSPSFFTST